MPTLLPDFRLETYFSKWEFTARYHLTASDAESLTLRELLDLSDDEGREAFERLWLGYTETFGAPDLRQAIARTYDGLSPEQILCFAGAQEAIYAAMHALLGRDDHAIVVTPNYQSAETVPLSLCEVTGVPLEPDGGWTLDLDRLAAALRRNTRLISINFPHNPTGKILERERFEGLVELCRERGIYLFSDEIFRLIERDPALRLPQAVDVYERGLSLNSVSKAYGLPGLRIGWITSRDAALLGRMERVKHYLSICNSAPSERLALIALEARDRILDRNRNIAVRNLELLSGFFDEFASLFEWYLPDGGVIGYPRYKGPEGVEAFAARLVEETGVLFLPASIFASELNPAPADRFRIGYGRSNLGEGLGVLRAHLQRNAG